jgi:hypothetical protein
VKARSAADPDAGAHRVERVASGRDPCILA